MYERNYYKNIFHINKATIILILLSMFYQNVRAGSKEGNKSVIETINFTVTVTDKSTSDPIQLVSVILKKKELHYCCNHNKPFWKSYIQ